MRKVFGSRAFPFGAGRQRIECSTSHKSINLLADVCARRISRILRVGRRLSETASDRMRGAFRSIWLISAITDPIVQIVKRKHNVLLSRFCASLKFRSQLTVLHDLTDRLLAERLFGASSCGMVCLL